MNKIFFRKLISKFFLYSKIYTDYIWINNFLKNNLITTVIDVGANTGQYALTLRRFGYHKKIISFEPGLVAHSKLLFNSKKDNNWKIYKKVGLGCNNFYEKLNISGNSVSSSFRPMNRLHITKEPSSKYIDSEQVKIIKLDDIFKKFYKKSKNIMLKIDTQGYEFEVIKGSVNSLKFIKCIQVELSFVELYKNQAHWLKTIKYLEKNHFQVVKVIEGFKDKKNQHILQADFFFINKKYYQ